MKIRHPQVAIVTGGASGIGRATAIAFAQEGISVVVSDINDSGGKETVDRICADGGKSIYVRADVSRSFEVAGLVQKTIDTYHRLDIAFNNAGIEGTRAITADRPEEDWERTIATNLTSVFLCMKYQLPEMLKQGKGSIVNCASIAGLVGFPGASAYVASKHGVVGLTKSTALEYAHLGIRVNAICPGVIHTPMIDRFTAGEKSAKKQLELAAPMGRMGTAEEIANFVVWLCSYKGSFMTGQAVAIDGGWTTQ